MEDDFDFVRKLQDGSLLVKAQFNSQVKSLMKLTQIHDFKIRVTIPRYRITSHFAQGFGNNGRTKFMKTWRTKTYWTWTAWPRKTRMCEWKPEYAFEPLLQIWSLRRWYLDTNLSIYNLKKITTMHCNRFRHISSRCHDKDADRFICGKCTRAHDTSVYIENTFKFAIFGDPWLYQVQ